MKKLSVKTMIFVLSCVAVAASLTGCGIPISINQSFEVINDTTIPAAQEGVLFNDYHEQTSEFCEIPSLDELRKKAVEEGVPAWLAKRIQIKSVEINSLTFEASKGDFSSFTKIEDILRADGKVLVSLIAENTGGFGSTVALQPTVAEDLAEYIEESTPTCLQNYLKIEGNLPTSELVFSASMDAKVVLRLRIL